MPVATRSLKRFLPAGALAIVAVLTLAACSSRSSGGATHQASSGNPATGTPINIGYANTEGKGALSFPTYTVGTELAIKKVNAEGGVNGHPLVLDKCPTDGTPASSLSCANTFVQHKDAVVLSAADIGVDAMVPVLNGAKIPAFSITFQGVNAAANPQFFQFGPPLMAAFSTPLGVLAQKVKNIALVDADVPVVHQLFSSTIKPLAAQLGVQVQLVTYDAAATDFTSVIATLNANKNEGVVMLGGEDACSAFAQSATTLGYQGLVMMGSCNHFIDKLGSRAAGYYSLGYVYPPKALAAAPAPKQAQLNQYLDEVKQAGLESKTDVLSLYGYASIIDLADVIKTAKGEVSAATVTSAFTSLSGFDSFDGDVMTCAHRPVAQGSACNAKLLVLQVKSDGTLSVYGGGFTSGT